MISKKKVNESDYDEYLMFIFWSISIPIYLFILFSFGNYI